MKKLLLLTATGLPVIFLSCQRELDDSIATPKQCRIIKGFYQINGVSDTGDFMYDPFGKVTRWKGKNGYYDYLYQGDNITTLTYKKNGTSDLLYLDSISYDGQHNLTQIDSYDFTQLPVTTTHKRYIFYYENTQLVLVTRVQYNSGSFPNDSMFIKVVWSGGNIASMISANSNNVVFNSIELRYDVNPNYLKSIHPHFLLFDPNLQMTLGFETSLASSYSQNNLIYVKDSSRDQFISYGLDSLNQLSTINMAPNQSLKYIHDCH